MSQPRYAMASNKRLHIGHLIKSVFDDSGLTIAEFARRINCARPNVYSIFERYDIGVEQLINISIALDHNFFDDIQRSFGLKESEHVKQLNISFDVEALSPEKVEYIARVLSKLSQNPA